MSRRLFSHDPVFGVTKFWHYDESSDTAVIETVQDIEPLLERNKALQNNQTRLDRWGEGRIAASIPMSEYAQLLADGRAHDQAALRRWINDPENRKYRTFLGRI
jgi:hypothetical protein